MISAETDDDDMMMAKPNKRIFLLFAICSENHFIKIREQKKSHSIVCAGASGGGDGRGMQGVAGCQFSSHSNAALCRGRTKQKSFDFFNASFLYPFFFFG